MPLLPYISDDHLIEYTKELVDSAISAQISVDKNPYKNVIDPFSALIDSARQGVSLDVWMEQEKSRQIQKAFQNAVGKFHQSILGAMPGWVDSGAGGSYDVINEDKKIIAEVKNKHNTMSSGQQTAVYDKMANWLDYGKSGYTGYVVDIVPKNPTPYQKPFVPSERGVRRQTRQNLLRIDGRSFYHLASGYEDAIDQLYFVLPKVLEGILNIDDSIMTNAAEFNTLFQKAYIKNK